MNLRSEQESRTARWVTAIQSLPVQVSYPHIWKK